MQKHQNKVRLSMEIPLPIDNYCSIRFSFISVTVVLMSFSAQAMFKNKEQDKTALTDWSGI